MNISTNYSILDLAHMGEKCLSEKQLFKYNMIKLHSEERTINFWANLWRTYLSALEPDILYDFPLYNKHSTLKESFYQVIREDFNFRLLDKGCFYNKIHNEVFEFPNTIIGPNVLIVTKDAQIKKIKHV